jgi:glycosyltransferase involved in cell wall biosynthesis
MPGTEQLAASENGARLHVLTLTPFFPSSRNPIDGCFVAEPIDEFSNNGVDSTVVAVSSIYRGRNQSVWPSRAVWLRYPAVPGIPGLSSSGFMLYGRLAKRISRLHQIKPIDVIHAHTAMPCGNAAQLLGRRLGIPFVVTVHGLDAFNSCAEDGIAARWRRQRSMEVYSAASRVICISSRVESVIKTRAPEISTCVIYNGVDAQLFVPNSDLPQPPVPEILAVGSLLPSKGHGLVLTAVSKLKSAFPDLRCRIIGEGPNRGEIESLAHKLGIEKQVQFLGRQTRAQVAEAMQRCSVFVLPSSNEGLGCVYLEAMACGKPIIGCRGQGIDGVVEHGKNGLLVPPDGLEELVQELSTLIRSPELGRQIGNAGRETVMQKFTLVHQAEQLVSVYRQAIATRVERKSESRS